MPSRMPQEARGHAETLSDVCSKGSPHRRPKVKATPPNINPDAPVFSPPPASPSLAHRAAQEVMQKPLSESLQKLRRAQRALTRRKRRSKVRVSFRHSTSSRTSGAAKRASRQLKAGDVKPGGGSPRSRPLPPPPSSSQDVGGCFGSPSKPPRPPPKDKVRGVDKQGAEKEAGEGRHRAALPEIPPPSPHLDTRNQTPGPQTEHIEAVADTKGKTPVSKSVDPNVKRRPVQTPTGQPRYSVFPKTHDRRKPSVDDKLVTPVKTEQRESIRRSLIQQRRLSALVPSDAPSAQTTTPVPQQKLPDLSKTPLTNQKAEAGTTTSEPQTEPRCSERTLDKFARELEEFARSTQAFDRTPGLLSTPATTQTQTSVRTVQEFLPYRQQFQEAGLAVTSVEQKAAPPVRKHARRQPPQSKLGTSRLNQFAPAQGVSSSGTKESSSGTVIHKLTRRGGGTVVLSGADETREVQEGEDKGGEGNGEGKGEGMVGSPNEKIYSASSSTFIEPVKLAAVEKKVVRLRPSTVFLANKPLPVAPGLGVGVGRGLRDGEATVGSEGTVVKLEGYQKLVSSSSGSEKEPLLPVSEQRQNSRGTSHSSGVRSEKGKEVDRGGPGKDEKVLPALPPLSRTSSQARHGIALASKSGWQPTGGGVGTAGRQLPTTIVEEREPSPEKREEKMAGEKEEGMLGKKGSIHHEHGLSKPVGILKAKEEVEGKEKGVGGGVVVAATPAQTKTPFAVVKRNVSKTITTASSATFTTAVTIANSSNSKPVTTNVNSNSNNKPITASSSKKPELLPKTWEHHPLGTPSSFKKALDDVVRKLDAMEVRERGCSPLGLGGLTSPAGSKKRVSSSGSGGGGGGKPPSPTPAQRLQKAAMMRRERIDAEMNAGAKPVPPQQQGYAHGMAVPPPLPMPPPGRLGFGPRELPGEARGRESSRGLGPVQNTRRGASRQFGGGMGMVVGMEDDRDISDRDVLKGLKIICAASADAEFDGLVQRETGLRLRRFLADLRTFEFLGGPGHAGELGGGQRQQMGAIEKRRRDVQVERESRRRSIRGLDGLRGVPGEGNKGVVRESVRDRDGRRRSIRLDAGDRESRRKSFRGLGIGLMR
ncbi:hypothetical protein QBC41DRAFT_389918 [Cercophora samala]|uniref:Uncharacterized protein n=1 Tax=Cercophora samala TaxID=330535 RepID=A0AA40DBI3_9PEZI|nr:hypothetical protein QBC41DRAFT_389918 [Cercophora samala]